MGRLILTA